MAIRRIGKTPERSVGVFSCSRSRTERFSFLCRCKGIRKGTALHRSRWCATARISHTVTARRVLRRFRCQYHCSISSDYPPLSFHHPPPINNFRIHSRDLGIWGFSPSSTLPLFPSSPLPLFPSSPLPLFPSSPLPLSPSFPLPSIAFSPLNGHYSTGERIGSKCLQAPPLPVTVKELPCSPTAQKSRASFLSTLTTFCDKSANPAPELMVRGFDFYRTT
jgi:hypothetical protein